MSALLAQRGAPAAEAELGISKKTLAWLAAGQPVLDGTVELVRSRLRELRAREAQTRPALHVVDGGAQ